MIPRPRLENMLANLPDASNGEIFQTLFESTGGRIERIISQGQATPEGEWYNQELDEWVMLVSGGAELIFENDATPLRLKQGDYIMIPAHQRHRVNWTDPDAKTVWLAIHFG